MDTQSKENLHAALDRAVLIRQYDRVDEANVYGVAVSVKHVMDRLLHETYSTEHFYDGECLRVTFNKDENDFIDAYFTQDIAHAAAAGLVNNVSQS